MEEQAVLDVMAEDRRQKHLQAEEKMKQLAEDTEALAHEIERLQMRKLIFEKGKALDWGVKKGGDVIFLKHLLCAAY